MTKHIRAPLIWTVVIIALLAGAYAVVARNPSAGSSQGMVGAVH